MVSVTALDGVSLVLEGNEYVSLLGPSGSGKTSLLRVIAGFEKPDAGTVSVFGRDVDAAGAAQARHRLRLPEFRAVPASFRL